MQLIVILFLNSNYVQYISFLYYRLQRFEINQSEPSIIVTLVAKLARKNR